MKPKSKLPAWFDPMNYLKKGNLSLDEWLEQFLLRNFVYTSFDEADCSAGGIDVHVRIDPTHEQAISAECIAGDIEDVQRQQARVIELIQKQGIVKAASIGSILDADYLIGALAYLNAMRQATSDTIRFLSTFEQMVVSNHYHDWLPKQARAMRRQVMIDQASPGVREEMIRQGFTGLEKRSETIGRHGGRVFLSIPVHASGQQLKEMFQTWLTENLSRVQGKRNRKPIGDVWNRYSILEYLDIKHWSDRTGAGLTDAAIFDHTVPDVSSEQPKIADACYRRVKHWTGIITDYHKLKKLCEGYKHADR